MNNALLVLVLFMALIAKAHCFSKLQQKKIAGVFMGLALGVAPVISPAVAAAGDAKAVSEQVNGLRGGRLLKCKTFSNCISTSSINSFDKYGRPWTFGSRLSAEQQFKEIKRYLSTMDFVKVAAVDDDNLYIRAEAKSAVPPSGTDDVEFLVNKLDSIIAYRSNSREVVMAGSNNIPDGGSNKNRLLSIQRGLGAKNMDVGGSMVDEAMVQPDFFKFQQMANEPSEINFLDNSVPAE